ncbi:MAG: 50S ribosomal protein L21 [Deltaproteobacteria bacterium]|nr:50S ribosomal protein L21 [Deltaproteobacteria bacterium]MBW2123049.1 50S ribosomal protein L21 [Deltaproteobacteria bacterium]
MYAVFRTGGKQYRASEGDMIRVERLEGEVGNEVRIKAVLMTRDEEEIRIGTPLVAEAEVIGRIVEQGKAGKIIVFKHKRRKGYRRKAGHRQGYTCLRIDKIEV